MKKNKFILLGFILVLPLIINAQVGGTYTYQFLNLTNSAHVAALGSKAVSLNDNDVALSLYNPALLSSAMNNYLSLNYVNYFIDINYGYATYAREYKNYGTFGAGMQYMHYGKFFRYDEIGIQHGVFYAADYAFNFLWSKSLDSLFRFGVAIKPLLSSYESYRSVGLVGDAGLTYDSKKHLLTIGCVIKNIGTQIKPYYKEHKEPVPFEIIAGISKKLRYAPLRFTITTHHLERWDLTYENPNNPSKTVDPLTGDSLKVKKLAQLSDKTMRHIIIGGEIMPLKNFYVAIGYNYQRRQEMKIETRPFLVGLSWGIGIKISKFYINYGRATYHIAGASNHFSIGTNLSDFYKKSTTSLP